MIARIKVDQLSAGRYAGVARRGIECLATW
jgi:hypothetical protein